MITAPLRKTDFKQAFIDALRSGQYQQCKDILISNDGKYCAMGVFHAINGDPKINNIGWSSKFHMSVFNRIAQYNDSGKSFLEIADILEAGLSEDLQSLNYDN